jgi:hypothetical protein
MISAHCTIYSEASEVGAYMVRPQTIASEKQQLHTPPIRQQTNGPLHV